MTKASLKLLWPHGSFKLEINETKLSKVKSSLITPTNKSDCTKL